MFVAPVSFGIWWVFSPLPEEVIYLYFSGGSFKSNIRAGEDSVQPDS